MSQTLDCLFQPPRRAGRPTALIALLHGVGSNKEDLIGLAPLLGPSVPGAVLVSIDGIEPCDMAPAGRQWFSLADRSPPRLRAEVERTAPAVDRFLDRLLADAGLAVGDLALVGFSQGTMMSLHLGLGRATPPACIVGFSGALLAGPDFAPASRPPVLLVHGDDDGVVPVEAMDLAAAKLRGRDVPVETLRVPGMGHTIDDSGLARAGRFLARHLPQAA
jgi:phospholipase/carboxylesterase